MSLLITMSITVEGGFPRSRGDEPDLVDAMSDLAGFSPLTRG